MSKNKILNVRQSRANLFWKKAKKMKAFYLMLLIPVTWILIFCYEPMYGVIIAFKDFKMGKGIWGSEWNNFENFAIFFGSPIALRVVRNTLILSLLNLLFSFPAPIILALLFNEVRLLRFKKVAQTISYLPHFLSWVVLATIITELLSPSSGIVNSILAVFGVEPIYFLADKSWFRTVVIGSGIWQSIGWESVIYLASIASINPKLYEASNIDGSTRFKDTIYITLPSLTPVITFFAIMRMSAILHSNFEQIYNLQNTSTLEVGEVLSTYVYRVGLIDANYGFSTAISLFVNVVGIIFLITANTIIKRVNEYALW